MDLDISITTFLCLLIVNISIVFPVSNGVGTTVFLLVFTEF